MNKWRLFMTPKSIVFDVSIVVFEKESPASDVLDGGHADLTNAHLVNHFQLHAWTKCRTHGFPHFGIEIGWQGSGAGQPFDQEVFPIGIFCTNCWKIEKITNFIFQTFKLQ